MDTEKILLEIHQRVMNLPCDLHKYRVEQAEKKIESLSQPPEKENIVVKYFYYIIIALISALTGSNIEKFLQ